MAQDLHVRTPSVATAVGTLRPDRVRRWLVGALFVFYVLLGVRGYGNDNDTYHMLNTWNVLRAHGAYQPSRGTGYLVPELAIGFLSGVGGHVLSNVAISALAAAVLWLLFGAVERRVDGATARLATLAVGLHPVWVVASSTSMDYLYSLAFFAFGLWAMDRQRWLPAGVCFGVSVSARITFAVAVILVHAAAVVAYEGDRSRSRGLLLSLVGAGLLAMLSFAPSFVSTGGTLAFLTFSEPQGFSITRAVANSVLNQLVFWGVPALVLIALYLLRHGTGLARAACDGRSPQPQARFLLLSSLLVFVWFEGFFLRLPAEAAYLLPALPALVLVIALGRRLLPGPLARRALALLLAFELVHGLVRLDFFRLGFQDNQPVTLFSKTTLVTVKSDIPLRSRPGMSASLGLYAAEGVLVEDESLRQRDQANWTRWLRDTWPGHPEQARAALEEVRLRVGPAEAAGMAAVSSKSGLDFDRTAAFWAVEMRR